MIVPHPNPDPEKKYGKPTTIYNIVGDGKVVRSNASSLTEASEITPSVSSMQVWFLGENQFGMSLKAETLFVKTKLRPSPLESMSLKRKYTEVDAEEEADVAAAASSSSAHQGGGGDAASVVLEEDDYERPM